MEQLGKIEIIAFDKTGTLTKGEPHVEKMIVYDERNFCTIAGSIEKTSSHPLGKSSDEKSRDTFGIELVDPSEVNTITGQGVEAVSMGKSIGLAMKSSHRRMLEITSKVH